MIINKQNYDVYNNNDNEGNNKQNKDHYYQ